MTTTYPGGTQTFNGTTSNACTPSGAYGTQGYSPAPFAGSTIGSPIANPYVGFAQPGFGWNPSYNWQHANVWNGAPSWYGAFRTPTFNNWWSNPGQAFQGSTGFGAWNTPGFSYPQSGLNGWFPQSHVPQGFFAQSFAPQTWNGQAPYGISGSDVGFNGSNTPFIAGYNGQFSNGYNTPFFGGYNGQFSTGSNTPFFGGYNGQFSTGSNTPFFGGYNGQFSTGYNTPFFGGYNGQFSTGYNTPFNGFQAPSFAGFPWSNAFGPTGYATNASFPGAYVNSTVPSNVPSTTPFSGICTQREAA